MKKLNVSIIAVCAIFALTACSKNEPSPEVSFQDLEDAKGTARENALFNAQRYRQDNILFNGWSLVGRGDSSQTNPCPQGDGWATVDFISPDRATIVKAKCSTVSSNTGCLTDGDFKTKPFAAEDGTCAAVNRVPFPLPKIAK